MSTQTAPVVAFLESRAGEQLGKLIARLGAVPLHAPALAEQPDIDPEQLREWITQWENADNALVIFQTGVGVDALFNALERLNLLPQFRALLDRSTVAVRGPKPSAALRKRQIRIDVSATAPFTSETLLKSLAQTKLDARAVYVQRHGGQNPELMDALHARGAKVMEITAYRWSLPQDTEPLDRLLAALGKQAVGTLVVTSASQIQNLVAHADSKAQRESCLNALRGMPVLSVGPVCSEVLRQYGITVSGEASPPKLGPLMELLEGNLRARGLLMGSVRTFHTIPLMPSNSLNAFLSPNSVAIVGAGDRPTSSGGAVLHNLLKSGYRGRIVPVNPKGGTLLGLPVARSLSEVTPAAELAVVVVRPDLILEVAKEAAASGHKNLLILPGGFAEGAEEGKARDIELRALARAAALCIGGPNCAGTINLLDKNAPFAATFFRDLPGGGNVGLVSQSGAIAEELIGASNRFSVPLGAIVSVGNSMQIGLTEYVEALGADARCEVILLYAESFGDAERFARVAREVVNRKPIIALLGGRTAAGGAAAFRHTGSQAMSEPQADEFCRQTGLVRVNTLRALMLAGKAFARYPSGIGKRILVLSNSGGPGVLCTDEAATRGLQIPDLPRAFADKLRSFLPPEASVANPIDLLADAREDRFGATLEAALQNAAGHFDAILMIHVIPFMVDAGAVVERLANGVHGSSIPIMHSMMGTLEDKDAWFARMESAGVPMFDNVEDMATAAGLLASRATA